MDIEFDYIKDAQLERMEYLDEAALSLNDERIEGMNRNIQNYEARYGSLEKAEIALNMGKFQLQRLKTSYNNISRLRQTTRNLNMFISAVMEERILLQPGQEIFAQFLFEDLYLFCRKPDNIMNDESINTWSRWIPMPKATFDLYIFLEYGDPIIPRVIPTHYAILCGIFPDATENLKLAADKKINKLKLDLREYKKDLTEYEELPKDLWRRDSLPLNFDWRSIWRYSYVSMPPKLAPRVLTEKEIALLKSLLFNLLVQYKNQASYDTFNLKNSLATIKEIIYFFHLPTLPESHIKTQSGQYVDKPYNSRTYADMAGEMAQELPSLNPYTAHVKIVSGGDIKQVIKRKIQTDPIPRKDTIRDEKYFVLRTQAFCCKERREVDEEIRLRRELWRRDATTKANKPWHRGLPNTEERPEDPPPAHS